MTICFDPDFFDASFFDVCHTPPVGGVWHYPRPRVNIRKNDDELALLMYYEFYYSEKE